MKIIRIFIIIFILSDCSLANENKADCVVQKLIVSKVGVDSISALFYDNGMCGEYKISTKGNGAISIIPDNATVRLDYADSDAYASSKIRAITVTDNDIIFNFDIMPQVSKYNKNKFTAVLITTDKSYLAIENKPLNSVEEINCDRSLGIVNIKTSYATKISYGRFSKTASYLDLYDTSLNKHTLKSSGCGGVLEYQYEVTPSRLRLIFKADVYKNLSAYHKNERSIVMSNFKKDTPVYVVKFITEKDINKDNINVVLSNGVVSKVDKLSNTEYVVEIDDNQNRIENVKYERKFANSYIKSISRQRAGKGDRFIVRVEKGSVLTIDGTELGFNLSCRKVFDD